jgi:hypothetical protein
MRRASQISSQLDGVKYRSQCHTAATSHTWWWNTAARSRRRWLDSSLPCRAQPTSPFTHPSDCTVSHAESNDPLAQPRTRPEHQAVLFACQVVAGGPNHAWLLCTCTQPQMVPWPGTLLAAMRIRDAPQAAPHLPGTQQQELQPAAGGCRTALQQFRHCVAWSGQPRRLQPCMVTAGRASPQVPSRQPPAALLLLLLLPHDASGAAAKCR